VSAPAPAAGRCGGRRLPARRAHAAANTIIGDTLLASWRALSSAACSW
jgi:hypothetical protein